MITLAQTGPIRLVIPEPPMPAPTPAASIDPLWVLLGLIAVALVVAGAMIVRTMWADMLQRRPADAALWGLLLRRGMGLRSYRTLRKLAEALDPQAHPVAVVCSPAARARALDAMAKTHPQGMLRARRVASRLDRSL